MKILFAHIHPDEKSELNSFTRPRDNNVSRELLELATISTNEGYEVTYADEFNGKIIDIPTDINCVIFTGHLSALNRIQLLSKECRKTGIRTIITGKLVHCAEENDLKNFTASVFINPVSVWKEILNDLNGNGLKEKYVLAGGGTPSVIDFSIAKSDPRLIQGNSSQRQVIRCCYSDTDKAGWVNNKAYFNTTSFFKDIESIDKEIEANSAVYFEDDNIMHNPEYYKALFIKLSSKNISWIASSDLSVAKDADFLKIIKSSGCSYLLLNVYGLNIPNQEYFDAQHMLTVSEVSDLLKTFPLLGIHAIPKIYVGFDQDTEQTFQQTFNILEEAGIERSYIQILTPEPGSAMHHALISEDRLLSNDVSAYEGTHVIFQPKHMSAEELKSGYIELVRKLFRLKFRLSIIKSNT